VRMVFLFFEIWRSLQVVATGSIYLPWYDMIYGAFVWGWVSCSISTRIVKYSGGLDHTTYLPIQPTLRQTAGDARGWITPPKAGRRKWVPLRL